MTSYNSYWTTIQEVIINSKAFETISHRVSENKIKFSKKAFKHCFAIDVRVQSILFCFFYRFELSFKKLSKQRIINLEIILTISKFWIDYFSCICEKWLMNYEFDAIFLLNKFLLNNNLHAPTIATYRIYLSLEYINSDKIRSFNYFVFGWSPCIISPSNDDLRHNRVYHRNS